MLQGITWNEKDIVKHAKLSHSEFSVNVKKDLTEIDISEKEKIQIRKLEDFLYYLLIF